MKIASSHLHEHGKILIVTLVLALLVGLSVGALLVVAKQQNTLTARSAIWSSEIPLAEAGIEEAMAHLNTRPKTLATNGWTKSGLKYSKTRIMADGYYLSTITAPVSGNPTIVSIGYGRIPLQTNFTSRTVVAMTKLAPPGWGVVAKQLVTLNGNPYVDSYDSSNEDYSTGGFYDPNKRRDRAGVGSLSTNKPAINTGGGLIYGSAATGVGGTVSGNVGDGAWLASSSGQQPGHVTDDFNMAIPDVALPSPWNPSLLPPLPGVFGGVAYGWVLTTGDWQFPATTISSSTGSIYVQGKVRLYFTGDFKMSSGASVTLSPGATLEVYLGGTMEISGRCVINPGGIPANCSIFGLPTCTIIKYAGDAAAYCKLYAPSANITVTGDFGFSGSVVGKNVTFSGNAGIHYDEALNNGGPDYKVVSWEEL